MTNCNCNLFIHKVTDVTKDSITIEWDSPRNDGNSPIRNYIVETRAVGDRTWMVANLNERVSGNKFTVTGIREGSQYEFRVSPVNKVGQGPASEISSSVKYGVWLFWNIVVTDSNIYVY